MILNIVTHELTFARWGDGVNSQRVDEHRINALSIYQDFKQTGIATLAGRRYSPEYRFPGSGAMTKPNKLETSPTKTNGWSRSGVGLS